MLKLNISDNILNDKINNSVIDFKTGSLLINNQNNDLFFVASGGQTCGRVKLVLLGGYVINNYEEKPKRIEIETRTLTDYIHENNWSIVKDLDINIKRIVENFEYL